VSAHLLIVLRQLSLPRLREESPQISLPRSRGRVGVGPEEPSRQ